MRRLKSARLSKLITLAGMLCALGGCASPVATSGIVDLRKELADSEPRDPPQAKHRRQDGTPADSRASATTLDVAASRPEIPSSVDDRPGAGFPPLETNSASPTPRATSAVQPPAGADPSIDQLATELAAAPGLDPAAKQDLLAELRQCDPSLRGPLVKQLRLMLAYRDNRTTPPSAAEPPDSEERPGAPRPRQSAQKTKQVVANDPQPKPDVQPASAVASDDGSEAQAEVTTDRQSADRPVALSQPGALLGPDGLPLRPPKNPKASSEVALAKANSDKRPAASSHAHGDEPDASLARAVLTLESAVATSAGGSDELRRQLQLRLLYLASGRRDEALRPIPGLSAAQQEFWTKELFGLATYLDQDRTPDGDRRATEAALHLREAAMQIGELASPVVRNLAFCKEVTSFGVYKIFAKYEFKAGDETLLYGEIENLKAESTDKGFRTALKSSYQILDSRGQRVAEQEFPQSDDFCANQRRDFFIPYFITIPKRINPGDYTLQLTVEDTLSKKIGQSTIQFSVKN